MKQSMIFTESLKFLIIQSCEFYTTFKKLLSYEK